MSGTVRSLNVSLNARTKKFDRGMKRAERGLVKFKATAFAIGGALKSIALGGALFGGLAVGALGVFVKRSLASGDALAKLSDRLGIGVQDLIAFRHAAALAGVEQSQFDKGLEKFVRSMGDAADGTGEQYDALVDLGLANERFFKLRPADQLREFADAIKGTSSQQLKASASGAILGRSGVQLINLLQQGSKEFDRVNKKLEEWNINIDRIDLAKMEAANDAMEDLRLVAATIFDQLVADLAPFIEESAKALLQWGKNGMSASDVVINGVAAAAEALGDFLDILKKISATFTVMKVGAKGAFEFVKSLLPRAGPGMGRVRGLDRKKIDELQAELGEALGLLGKPGTTGAKFRRKIEEIARAAQKRAEEVAAAAAERTTPQFGGPSDRNAITFEQRDPAKQFAQRSGAIVQQTISGSIANGIFNGFRDGENALELFGQAITRTIVDAFVQASIGQGAANFFQGIFRPIFGSNLASQTP